MILILLSLLPSCSCDRQNDIGKLSANHIVVCDTLAVIGGDVRVQDICVDDSLIVLLTSGNPMLFVMNKNTGNIEMKTGFIGHASNEYLMTPHAINIRNHEVQFLDRASKKMCYVSLIDSHRERKRSVPYTAGFRPAKAVDINGDLVCVGSFSQGRLGYINADNIVSIPEYEYPYDTGDVEGIYRGSIYQSVIRAPGTCNRCLVYSLASDSFEIYESESGAIKRLYASPVKSAPVVVKYGSRISVDHNRSTAGILHAAVTDSSIFMMFSSLSYNEAAKSGFKGDRITEVGWDGTRKSDYTLPVAASSFCADIKYFYMVCEDSNASFVIRVPRRK